MMNHFEVAAFFEKVLPCFYMYPQSTIQDSVPCITFRLGGSGNSNTRQLTVYIDLWCSLVEYDGFCEQIYDRIEELPRRSAGATWTDFFDPSVVLKDGAIGLAHRAFQFVLN